MNSTTSSRSAARGAFPRGAGLAALVLLAGFCGGCATQASADKVELFVRRAPLPQRLARGEVMAAAERAAAAREGDFALHGVGRSMEPVYAAGTAIVVHPTSYHMLRKGMPVVYTNARGEYIAHMLVEKTERGWRAIGLNNAEPDAVLVTERNFAGIIQQAFSPAEAVPLPAPEAAVAATIIPANNLFH